MQGTSQSDAFRKDGSFFKNKYISKEITNNKLIQGK